MSKDTILPGQAFRARGAASNAAGRYEATTREAHDDGWDIPHDERLVRTEVRLEAPRSAITYNQSPDLPFDRSINPYRGCEHGCIYCFARPTHAYLNLSPGLDFETKLIARPGIGAVLDRELRARSYKPAVIALGTNTDPYQPIEAEHRVMREVLEVLSAHRHPLAITTKGTLIERDLDILAPMAADGLLRVGITVTTLDDTLSRRMEPRVPRPARRLQTIRRLTEAGVPVRVMVSPLIPGLSDHELEPILQAAKEAGALAASWIHLRLPLEVAELFKAWLAEHYPDRAAKVMGRVRELHGGKDYDAAFGQRFKGQGIWADLMRKRFEVAIKRLGLTPELPPLRTDLFRPPLAQGAQMGFDL
ncbi:PA0069 family radical SAM protein [Stagnihabitans tardus]|uniref:PA0069 family radical SAM protein n=1 Tax=Stagnihabitans tardus TaxID=2699202 RepID=A0AAE5BRW1_9RHOB|nr:PA0069 family radical SAM protein [Stagnihabitans tardus]NBZ87050.1 PA0069 family radical SAM protein [Stagnihabitans tardus]